MKTERQYLISNSQGSLTFEQYSLIKLYDQLKKRELEAHEVFSAMDIDDNQQVTCEELGKFLKSLLNENDLSITKNVEDKDLRFFMQYMDLDRNQLISKGEFLKYY